MDVPRPHQIIPLQVLVEPGKLKQVTDVNELFYGRTLLHHAVLKGNLKLAQTLLEHRADVSVKDRDGQTPLFVACSIRSKESYDFCKLLVDNGADCNSQHFGGTTPFHRALERQFLNIVELLDYLADIRAVDHLGKTSLHYAACNRHVDVLEFALNQGLDIERVNVNGNSALHYAAKFGTSKSCELLLKRGAMVDKRTPLGKTPLVNAAVRVSGLNRKKAEIVQVLLDYGADVTTEYRGQSILRLAASREGNRAETDDVRNVLLRHMARMRYKNLTISQDDRQMIENDHHYRTYYQRCSQEFEIMKETRVYNNVSAFSIFMGSQKVISGYARCEELVRALEKNDYHDVFPIYFALLKRRFDAAVRRQRLLHTAANILSNAFVFNGPAHPVNQNILTYFRDGDLNFLCGCI